jgi:hypothetical protein
MDRLFFAGLALVVLAPFTYSWFPVAAILLLVVLGFVCVSF